MLPVDTESDDYKFRKTLNEDVKLVSDSYGSWDLDMDNGDYINVTGLDSLLNACIIAILTRFNELYPNPTYTDFGCHVHELIKANQTRLVLYQIETDITDVLLKMRRVNIVNFVNVSENKTDAGEYDVNFSITSINDEIVEGSVSI